MSPRLLLAGLCVAIGAIAVGGLGGLGFESELVVEPLVSGGSWESLATKGGGAIAGLPGQRVTTLPGWLCYGLPLGVALLLWIGGGLCLSRQQSLPISEGLYRWGMRGSRWSLLAAIWSLWWVVSLAMGATSSASLCAGMFPYVIAIFSAGLLAEFVAIWRSRERSSLASSQNNPTDSRWPLRLVSGAALLYLIVFVSMNWGLWWNLQIPHGDSAMYEEHLWNVEHGKGFRSYLDQGLFLGEHIQVIHLLLIPIHWIWPSHLLLEFAESLALVLGVIPLFSMAKRHSRSDWGAVLLCVAYLLYFPMQYLDIAIDFKTFRPIAFGVPLLLATLDQLERGRFRTMTSLALLTLCAKEDYAIPLSLIGFWLMLFPQGAMGDTTKKTADDLISKRRVRIVGAAMWLAGAVYLLVVVKFAIPAFRSGETVHYARYFAKFGTAPLEIVGNMVTRPDLLFQELVTVPAMLYVAALLVPLGLLPLLSPTRLLVGAPLLVLLCLNELAMQPPGPFHHFHAPLVPILFWGAAAGMKRCVRHPSAWLPDPVVLGTFAVGCSLLTGVAYSLSPLGTRFWDSGRMVAARPTYWRAIYLPDERAQQFEKIAPLIPPSAHVASTDFVHPRFTHCERSYDFSGYKRRVAQGADSPDRIGLPADTDYVVLDLRHPYTAELLQRPDLQQLVESIKQDSTNWEELPTDTSGHYQVFRRRSVGK